MLPNEGGMALASLLPVFFVARGRGFQVGMLSYHVIRALLQLSVVLSV